MAEYKNRIADRLLAEKLSYIGAVLVQGPKWCGKTTTAEQHAKSVIYLNDPSKMEQNLQLAKLNIKSLLKGDTPRLLDEWQLFPELWDAVRFTVDHRDGTGQFILTGSAVPADKTNIHHTGTGRFSWLTMRTMSLWESGDSTGEVSLGSLFTSPEQIEGYSEHDIDAIAYLICRGGWPGAVNVSNRAALKLAGDYYDAVVNSDLSRVDGVRRNPQTAMRIMRSLSRYQGTQTPLSSIRKDIKLNEKDTIDDDTVYSYVDAMKKIFVIEDAPSWNPNLRSRSAIRVSDTRYYCDPSVAVAALGIGPDDLINDLNTMGLLFETMCVRDLRVYASALNGNVYHYRDSNGLECDAVVHLRNGRYGLVEIKLGGMDLINEGAATLAKLAGIIDTTKMPAPSFRMVLTAVGNYAYRMEDGTYVVPVGCLRD